MDDDQATLNLAKQIGMKANFNPSISIPVKQDKYNAAHFKLAFKYFHQRKQVQKRKSQCSKKQSQQFWLKQQSNQSKLGLSMIVNRNLYSSMKCRDRPKINNQDFRVQTARTTFGRCHNLNNTNNSLPNKVSQRSQIKQNKNLLFDIWKQQLKMTKKESINIKPKTNNFFNTTEKKKKKNKQIRLQYNSKVKSFQFC